MNVLFCGSAIVGGVRSHMNVSRGECVCVLGYVSLQHQFMEGWRCSDRSFIVSLSVSVGTFLQF